MQYLPEQPERVETGPVQFGEDWPGVFIRGDNAGHFAMVLEHVIGSVNAGEEPSPIDLVALEGLANTLKGCIVK